MSWLKTRNEQDKIIARLDDKILVLQQRLSDMTDKAIRLERSLNHRDQCLKEAEAERQSMRGRITKQTTELADLKKKVRKQTEADILLNALQAVKIIPDDKPNVDYQAKHDMLNAQLQGLRNMYYIPCQADQQSAGPFGLRGLGL